MKTDWTVVSKSEFEALAPQWDALHATTRGVPFLQSAFMRPALEILGDGTECVAICGSRAQPAAMGIFVPDGHGRWRTFQPSQLPIGAFLTQADIDLDRSLGELIDALSSTTILLAITQQDPDILRRPSASATIETVDYIETARVSVVGSFADYWAARGKNLRHNVKRQRAKLDEANTPGKLEVVEEAHEVAAAIAEYGRLETAGWKSDEGTAVHPDNAQGRFYCAMLENFCRAGTGRIYRYRIGEHIAAMDLCIEHADVLTVLKTTYDESMRAASPATLMRHEYFATLFEGGRIRRIEFYGRLMEWHTRWTNEVRTLYHINRYRSGWLKRAREAVKSVRGRLDNMVAS